MKEFKVLTHLRGSGSAEQLEEDLNRGAEEGWELVSVADGPVLALYSFWRRKAS